MSDVLQQVGEWFARELPSSEFVPVGTMAWWRFTALILFGRACDLGSTYLATPRLRLEGNPLARRLGWRGGILFSLAAALIFGGWPLIAISITTTSMLVAARNLQHAWVMRSLGEERYQDWFCERVWESPRGLVIGCHWGEALLSGLPGLALVVWGEDTRVSLGIGLGMTVYGLAVAIFSTWILWGLGRQRARYRKLSGIESWKPRDRTAGDDDGES
jgi:hypothetical protein